MKNLFILIALFGFFSPGIMCMDANAGPAWLEKAIVDIKNEFSSELDKSSVGWMDRGVNQVGAFWREEDGDEEVFKDFVKRNFARDEETLNAMFGRFENHLEKLDGHMNAIILEFKAQMDLDRGDILPFDEVFAGYDPSAHVLDDYFKNKLAFVVLLNFPLTTLQERLEEGRNWTRMQWARARLAQRFSKRIPAEVSIEVAQTAAMADKYVAGYNIWMHHLVNDNSKRLFPEGMRLLSHWNLRDELKARYSEGREGLDKQRMIRKIMERIVDQSIPEIVIDNPTVDWNPFSNEVRKSGVKDYGEEFSIPRIITNQREPDRRYKVILGDFRAVRKIDVYSPTAPTLMARRFDEDREIPEERVKSMFEKVLSSPLVGKAAGIISSKLGRPLEPFDIWYDGFKPRGTLAQKELDEIVRERYPNPEAYKNDIPNLLTKLGFNRAKAQCIANYIEVDPARGSGHAWGGEMRFQNAHLRTRVGKMGMDYKGFNIAVHEMGHNVEQVLSMNQIDHTLLHGVPNNAFTEAMAFVFQARDLELLGLGESNDPMSEALKTLDTFWNAYEICGVALVDIAIWHWMYEHPQGTPEELREATMELAKDVWNKYYAAHLGEKDVYLLAIYSHIINNFLYIPDYPIGFFIAYQIEDRMKKSDSVGEEFERMVTIGNIAPDLWMEKATGSPVGPEALLEATAKALKVIKAH